MTLQDIVKDIERQHLYVWCLKINKRVDNLVCAYACRKYTTEVCFKDLYEDNDLDDLQANLL